ncbi:uncharacterized protein JCM6883_002153 [Sporobolomyces salmoneus]|uniref:uncharacterized protein n=1 Tax=Sporobolomyces salmoneus TaxID=183962 RepID=UPI00316E0432
MPPPVTDLDDADEETTLAWLIQEAFKQICTTTSILANGEGHLNSYDIENYRCEARDLISDPSGPQIDPSNRIQWHKYRIPAVKMQVCRDIHGSPPDWLACSRSVNPWELPGHVFATIPGPTLAGVVGPHGQAIPEHATGMAEFCNKGCWVTGQQVESKVVRTATRSL